MTFDFESKDSYDDSSYFSVTRKTINGTLSHNFTQGRSVDDLVVVDNQTTIDVNIFREDYSVEPRHDLGFYVISLKNNCTQNEHQLPSSTIKVEISLQLCINNLEVSIQQFANNQNIVMTYNDLQMKLGSIRLASEPRTKTTSEVFQYKKLQRLMMAFLNSNFKIGTLIFDLNSHCNLLYMLLLTTKRSQ